MYTYDPLKYNRNKVKQTLLNPYEREDIANTVCSELF